MNPTLLSSLSYKMGVDLNKISIFLLFLIQFYQRSSLEKIMSPPNLSNNSSIVEIGNLFGIVTTVALFWTQ